MTYPNHLLHLQADRGWRVAILRMAGQNTTDKQVIVNRPWYDLG